MPMTEEQARKFAAKLRATDPEKKLFSDEELAGTVAEVASKYEPDPLGRRWTTRQCSDGSYAVVREETCERNQGG